MILNFNISLLTLLTMTNKMMLLERMSKTVTRFSVVLKLMVLLFPIVPTNFILAKFRINWNRARGYLNEIGTNRKCRGRMVVIMQRMTALSSEDHFVFFLSAFFVRIKCLWFSQNACIFKFHYTGEGALQFAIHIYVIESVWIFVQYPRYKITVTQMSLVFMQLSVMGVASEVIVLWYCMLWCN